MSEPTRADLRRIIAGKDAEIDRMALIAQHDMDLLVLQSERITTLEGRLAMSLSAADGSALAAAQENVRLLIAERDSISATLERELKESGVALRRAGAALDRAGGLIDDLRARLMQRMFWPKWAELAMFTVASGIGLADLFMLADLALGHHRGH